MKNIAKYINTNNWFDFSKFYQYIANKKFDTLVEVGVWKGHSISFLAREMQKLKLNPKIYAVDLWDDVVSHNKVFEWKNNKSLQHETAHMYEIYNEVKKRNGVTDLITDIKGVSWEVANKFEDESVDFVFIDAAHDYESVVKDINAWLPKIKNGGIISGHDLHIKPGVTEAVKELIQEYKRSCKSVWYKEVKEIRKRH